MTPNCPHCQPADRTSLPRPKIKRSGHFRRKSDSRRVQKFQCLSCCKYFSTASFHPCVRQKKRHFNERIRRLFCSGVSQRRAAKILNLSRTTIARKLIFLADQSEQKFFENNLARPKVESLEFDDLETFEHTKYKPLSVTLAVEQKSRRILGFEVSSMPAKGLLARRAIKKYGFRKDERALGRETLFAKLKPLVAENLLIKSDQNPHYLPAVNRHFPQAIYEQHKGQRGSIVGQGELKKVRFDPLFSLNHTCAMLRANVNRLFRKTWCTTKKAENLRRHLYIYAVYHNLSLIDSG